LVVVVVIVAAALIALLFVFPFFSLFCCSDLFGFNKARSRLHAALGAAVGATVF
jgi:hypothetical protein